MSKRVKLTEEFLNKSRDSLQVGVSSAEVGKTEADLERHCERLDEDFKGLAVTTSVVQSKGMKAGGSVE